MTRDEIIEHLEERYPDGEFVLADGFEDAFVGVVTRFGMDPVVLYDYDKCIQILMSDDMNQEAADEYFGFNVLGAWNGEGTPAFAMLSSEYTKKLYGETSLLVS